MRQRSSFEPKRIEGGKNGVYQAQGRWAEALVTYEQSLAIKRALGDRHSEGKVLANVARLHAQQGRMDEAFAGWQKALALFRELDAPEVAEIESVLALSRRPGCLRALLSFGRLLQRFGWGGRLAARARRLYYPK